MPHRLLRYRYLKLKRRAHHALRELVAPHVTPRELGRGMAIGIFIGLSPFFGVHVLLALVFAWMLRANKVLALTAFVITNPWTAVPIYIAEGKVAEVVIPYEDKIFTRHGMREMMTLVHHEAKWSDKARFVYRNPRMRESFKRVFVGSLIVGIPSAILGYWLVYEAASKIHIKRLQLHRRREERHASNTAP